MLIPYATDRPRRRTTVVVHAIIAVNVAVWLMGALLGPDAADAMVRWGWLARGDFHWWGLFTSQFLHAGLLHLLGNMIFLFAMGPPVEDRLGRPGFLAFYLAGGAAAGATHMLFDAASPVVGASGAIAAVTGAFLVMFPNCNIRVISFLLIYIGRFEIPAWWFIGFQLAWNLVMPALGWFDRVSYAAHLGGYAFGIAIAFGLLSTGILKHEPYDLFTALRQASRRRQIRSAVEESARRRERTLRPDKAPTLPDNVMRDRGAVHTALTSNEPDAVVRAYTALRSHDGNDRVPRSARVFPPGTQLELANHLFAANAYRLAADAYEDLLDRAHTGPDAQTARVLLARLYAGFLSDPTRARSLLDDAMSRGLSPDLAEAAREELESLPGSAPPETPAR